MNLHEFQAKDLLEQYEISVSKRSLIRKRDDIEIAARAINAGAGCVAKVQAHTGGRGKVGGVKICKGISDINAFVDQWLGKRVVTVQTGDEGLPVNIISLETLTDISKELYLSFIVDRVNKSVSIILSPSGGMNIEEVAKKTPDKIFNIQLDHNFECSDMEIQKLAPKLGLNNSQTLQLKSILQKCSKLFIEKDLSLLEINPLVVNKFGDLICLDAKINVDDNALFRHEDILRLKDISQEDDRENEANENDLSYVSLEGNIGCMVNGAGLAMGTMDTIKLYDGNPANFLDVGGTATKERVSKAFKLILSDSSVKAILVNIFGGIVRCDLIAQGIIEAISEISVAVPIVVRLQGNKSSEGKEILNASNLNVIGEDSLEDAAKKVIGLVK